MTRVRPALLDVAIALVLTVAGQINLWVGFDGYYPGGPRALNVVLTLVATGAVAWRRRFPLEVLGVEFLVFPVARALGAGMTFWGDFVPFFLATGTVAAEVGDRRRALALALPALGFLLALGRPGTRTLNDVAFYALVLAVSFGLGDALRRIRERALVLARRAVELEHAQDAVLAAERARIARELHDVVAHNLSVAIVQTAGAERVLGDERPEVRRALRRAQDAGREALGEMQLMLGLLRGGADGDERAPRPSLERLGALADQVRGAGVPVELHVEGDPAAVPAAIDLAAYRIVQEALTNVLKHAAGAPTRVSVRCGPEALELSVVDAGGRTRRVNGHPPGGGHGLVGMRERAQLHGGRLEARPRPEGGFAVSATLPLAR
jgi:signal transduction histidine kinase